MVRDLSSSPNRLPNDESTSGQLASNQLMGVLQNSMSQQHCNSRSNSSCSLHALKLNHARIIVAEVLGTFILMFSIFGIMGSMRLLGSQVGLMEYAITAGSSIMLVIFTVGEISGAHINPAITISFALFGHFPWFKVPFYVSAQILGAILATYVGELVFGVKPELVMTLPRKDGAVAALFAELIATFMVTFLAASLAKEAKSVGHLAPFALGLAIALAVLITGPISGGSLNPARSLGPAIFSRKFDYLWVYFLGPIGGAILGVLMAHALCLKQSLQSSTITSTVNSLT